MRHLFSTAAVVALTAAAPLAASAQESAEITCPGPFPVVDTNSDGKVTGEEASAALEDEFSRIDADGDGNITAMEWQTCGNAGLNEARMHTMMDAKASDIQAGDHAPRSAGEQSDANMNTMMDAEASDIQAGDHAPMDSAAGQPMSAEDSASTATLNEEGPPRPWWTGDEPYQQADTDDSGTVTRAEAANAAEFTYGRKSQQAKAQQSPEQAARESGARFTMLDRDGNGVISASEWKNRDQADLMALFDRLDQDGNDKLSKSEFQTVKAKKDIADEPVTIWYYYTY